MKNSNIFSIIQMELIKMAYLCEKIPKSKISQINMRTENVSLIIATYNWPEALRLCLNSILQQTVLPSEIIIADDGSNNRTAALIHEFSARVSFPVFHEWHEDKGFRKTIILNKALLRTSNPYIIQIDGDIIITPHFIEDHLFMAEKGCFIRGTRAILSPQITNHLFSRGKLSILEKLRLIINQPTNALRFCPLMAQFATRKELSGRRVKGCNMSFWKEDLLAVNGYNNTLQGWGHEDEELSYRLVNLGRYKKIIKFSAIAYHIYHTFLSRKNEFHHLDFLRKVQDNHIIRTDDGLDNAE